jgi:cell wall-associated NlpC family hydrolase
MRHPLQWLAVFALATGLTMHVPPASAAPLAAKQAQAASLEAKIRAQGQRLSVAGEDYNEARLARQSVQARTDGARSVVVAAEQRWGALRDQLGKRARALYMHPGAALNAFFGAQSLGDVERARVYGGQVLLTDSGLVMKAEKARHEVIEQAKALEALRSQAERRQDELAARRVQVQRELTTQQALLRNVKGDIAKIIQAEHEQQLKQAAQQAAAPQAASAPSASRPGPAALAPTVDSPATASEQDVAPSGPPPAVRASAGKAVETARAQLGKPYEFAAAGPSSFDCSGLTMYAWNSAGVSLPHSSRAQYSSLPHIARSQLQPGDLVFYGSPIHHVGIYEGGGTMINAPETGENVRRDSISRPDYVGAARP